MKNDLLKLIQWFCSKLTYNDLASVVPVLQEVLSGSRKNIDLKPDEDRPPNYRHFRVDPTLPLTEPPEPVEEPPEELDSKIPAVYLEYEQNNAPAGRIKIDEADIGRMAARHFLRKGHRHFAYVAYYDRRVSTRRQQELGLSDRRTGSANRIPKRTRPGRTARHPDPLLQHEFIRLHSRLAD